jgi:hypothetical protein
MLCCAQQGSHRLRKHELNSEILVVVAPSIALVRVVKVLAVEEQAMEQAKVAMRTSYRTIRDSKDLGCAMKPV